MSDVKFFWDGRARDSGLDDVEVTHRDVWQRWLEIRTIEKYLGPGDRVLDIGCGSGHATKIFAPRVKEILGIDFSAGMIARAGRDAPEYTPKLNETGARLALDRQEFGDVSRVMCLILERRS